jgi:hypothetical protein
MSDMWTVERLLSEDTPVAQFAAVRVASLLAECVEKKNRGDQPAQFLKEVDNLDSKIVEEALPAADALIIARASIRIAATDPASASCLDQAILNHSQSKQQLATGVLEVGAVFVLAVLVAKLNVKKDADGEYEVKLEPISNESINKVAEAIAEVAKVVQKLLDRVLE